MNHPDVASLRAKIRVIDHELLKLLGKRMALVKDIGLIKKNYGLGVVDPAKEKEILDWAKQQATEQKIPTELVQSLFTLLINHSVSIQSEL